jgi:hypothetical protein
VLVLALTSQCMRDTVRRMCSKQLQQQQQQQQQEGQQQQQQQQQQQEGQLQQTEYTEPHSIATTRVSAHKVERDWRRNGPGAGWDQWTHPWGHSLGGLEAREPHSNFGPTISSVVGVPNGVTAPMQGITSVAELNRYIRSAAGRMPNIKSLNLKTSCLKMPSAYLSAFAKQVRLCAGEWRRTIKM